MTVKSIIDIDVDDQKFKDFLDLYKKFQDELNKMPGAWNTATAAASGVTKETDLVAAALIYQTELLAEQAREQSKLDRQTSQAAKEKAAEAQARVNEAKALAKVEQERHKADLDHYESTKRFWSEQATMTGKVVRNVTTITKDLIGFAVKGVGLGLLGGGLGLLGIDALANRVSDRRVAAQGLGISTGENQAFQLNFGNRLGLGLDLIGRVQDAQSDISKSWQFGQLGISQQRVGSENHAELSADVIRRARELWDQAGPGGHNQQWMGSHGLSGFMDFSQWQTIGAQSKGDIDKYADQYVRDSKSLSVGEGDQKDWQDLSIQLKRAGDQIENVFIKGLAPLSKPLGELSNSISEALRTFLANPDLKVWTKDFGDGIEHFAKYIGTPEFKQAVSEFATEVVEFVKAIKELLPDLKTSIEIISGAAHGVGAVAKPFVSGPGDHGVLEYDRQHPETGVAPGSSPSTARPYQWWNPGSWLHHDADASPMVVPNAPGGSSGSALSRILGALSSIESSNRDHPQDTFDGHPGQWHKGRYQMSEDMLKKYGVTDPYDYNQVTPAAGKEQSGYLEKFHGNVAQAIAAWNEGPGAVDRQVREAAEDRDHTGHSWLERASRPVQNYVEKAASKMGLTVTVINQTGAQVAISANATQQ